MPLTMVPVKGDYSKHDFARSARYLGLEFRMPDKFPLATQYAARAYYWLHGQDCGKARAFAHAVFRGVFVENKDMSDPALVLEVAAAQGLDTEALAEAVKGEELKARLKTECDTAIARGVFGAPFFFIDGEPFWGADRLPQIEKWLAEGKF